MELQYTFTKEEYEKTVEALQTANAMALENRFRCSFGLQLLSLLRLYGFSRYIP